MNTTIISGKANAGIDPVLNMWHWEIPVYLFLGGLAAGILFFSALFTLLKRNDECPASTRTVVPVAPIAISIGLIALLLDLTHKAYFWQLYTTFRIESPMSWGAWVLLLITPVSIIWSIDGIKLWFPALGSWKLVDMLQQLKDKYKSSLAWLLIILSLILGVYTGILLSAFNARPLWNTSVLGFLFLVSGMSTGAALIMLVSKSKSEKHLLGQIDLALIVVELFLITHMFMGFRAGTSAKLAAADLFLGGEYTIPFWILVVGAGLVLPAILEWMTLKRIKIPKAVVPLLVIFGGVIFRFIMVNAGQVSSY